MNVELKKTDHGFGKIEFQDRYKATCSLQESSLASEACIWLGVHEHRMHLTQEMAAALLPYLHGFVETGELRAIAVKAEGERFLDISTAHLSPDAKAWLSECGTANHAASYHGAGHGGSISTLGTTLCGWFMHTPSFELDAGDMGGMPDDLKTICRRANELGCHHILFDADAEIIGTLPTWQDDISETDRAALDDAMIVSVNDAGQVEAEAEDGTITTIGKAYDPKIAELQEIADGAKGDGPYARGWARDEIKRLRSKTDDAGIADELAEPGELDQK